MQFKNRNIDELIKLSERKKLVCFGANSALVNLCTNLASTGLYDRFDFITDVNCTENTFTFNGIKKPLIRFDWFLNKYPHGGKFVLVVTDISAFYQLLAMKYKIPDNITFYLGEFLLHNPPQYEFPVFPQDAAPRIPKILHYCWFGRNPLPEFYIKCIDSWKKYCPDYEIIQWNEDNYDITKNAFMKEAYNNKKWAFVSDYARLDVVYNYGGVYLDTDVELLKPLDHFLYNDAFCGAENIGMPAFGTPFGAAKGHELIRKLRDFYDDMSFYNKDGTLNMTPNTIYLYRTFTALGIEARNDVQIISGMTIYPTDVFCPVTATLIAEAYTDKTHSAHHFGWSWGSQESIVDKQNRVTQFRNLLQLYSKDEIYHFPLPAISTKAEPVKDSVTVIFEPQGYGLNEKHISETYDATRFISLDESLVGTKITGKDVESLSLLKSDLPKKVVIAVAFTSIASELTNTLVALGVSGDSIITLPSVKTQ